MKKKEKIKMLENKVEQLEKDLSIQKFITSSILTLQGMKFTGSNSVKPFEPVKLEPSPKCKCEMR